MWYTIIKKPRQRSHPARGAWIEILIHFPPKAARKGRTPQGVRGLKFRLSRSEQRRMMSHPARGAWIEMQDMVSLPLAAEVAPRKGCVD